VEFLARFLALSAEPAPGFAQDFQDRGLLSASRSSYSALWSASARFAVSAASFLTCSAASSLALNLESAMSGSGPWYW